MRKLTAFLLIVIFFGGCDLFSSLGVSDKQGSLAIETNRDTYTPGQTLEVTIKNDIGVPVFYDGCGTWLQRKENGEWKNHDAIVCAAIVRESIEIESGDQYTQSFPWFNNDYEEGTYRLVLNLELESGELLPKESRTVNLSVVSH